MGVRVRICLVALLLAGCVAKTPAPSIVAVVPPPAAPPAAMPPGATPGMLVPAALADGSFPTPNQHVSAAAALWHLRAGLNVAALSCPAEQGAAITTGYNALLGAHAAELKAAEASYAAEYRSSGDPQWRDRYDNAMTRLYNFFSQTPVRPGFCTAAGQVLAQAAAVPAGSLNAFAAGELGTLDRPFVDFYRAYDAWRMASMPRPVIAVSAAAPPSPTPLPTPPRLAGTPPQLQLDLSTLPSDAPTG